MSKLANEIFDFFKFLASSLESETRYLKCTRETKIDNLRKMIVDFYFTIYFKIMHVFVQLSICSFLIVEGRNVLTSDFGGI